LRGLLAVIFGTVALIWPEPVSQALVLVFGAFVLVDGVLSIFAGLSSAPFFAQWWGLLLEGMAGVFVGLMAFLMPSITGRALIYLIAAWALVAGIFEIIAAIQLRRVLRNEWMLILGGLLSVVMGVLLLVFPEAGAVSLIWTIAIYTIILGVSEIVFTFRLRGAVRDFEKTVETGKKAIE
jgi:uncharacterized membrane protein HdeD (DUF308 family)